MRYATAQSAAAGNEISIVPIYQAEPDEPAGVLRVNALAALRDLYPPEVNQTCTDLPDGSHIAAPVFFFIGH